MHPDLLEDVSDTLRKRMQRKSCSNVTRIVPSSGRSWRISPGKGTTAPGLGGASDAPALILHA